MKNIIILLIIILTTLVSFTQAHVKQSDNAINDNTQIKRNCSTDVYQLFLTKNTWPFIKLNTQNGKLWQVQYDVSSNNRFEVYINPTPLVEAEKEVNGRFTLYPTHNMYNFILLDQISGRIWQVQWSMEAEQRLVIPIKSTEFQIMEQFFDALEKKVDSLKKANE